MILVWMLFVLLLVRAYTMFMFGGEMVNCVMIGAETYETLDQEDIIYSAIIIANDNENIEEYGLKNFVGDEI